MSTISVFQIDDTLLIDRGACNEIDQHSSFVYGAHDGLGRCNLTKVVAIATLAVFLFPYPDYGRPIDAAKPGSKTILERDGLRSSSRIADAINGSADFVIGDLPLDEVEAGAMLRNRGTKLLNLPTAVTAAVPCYNLPGSNNPLNFSPGSLAGIFLGKIANWNDEAIARDNPGVLLPFARIILVQETDKSGTTDAWTAYLTAFSSAWRKAIGRKRSVSLSAAMHADNPEINALLVQRTPYSISFVELWAAKKLSLQEGRVRNGAGRFVEATSATMTATVAHSVTTIWDPEPSLVSAAEADAYPICGFTWIAIPVKIDDPDKREKILSLVKWILTDGQQSTDILFYAHLPKKLVNLELKLLSEVH